jgi:hypothetical protein
MTNLTTVARPSTAPAQRVTWDIRTGPVNPTNYRRLLEILFSPDTETIDADGLHTKAA